ncbi:MAG: SDR family NAD(P)-dependent oxidoreductase [Thermoplasmata archaeon]
MRFEGKAVLITGGTGALGAHVTRAFLDEGGRVGATWIVDGEPDDLRTLVGDRGESLELYRTDLFDAEEIQKMVADVLDAFGTIDILVNVVGGYLGGPSVAELRLKEWEFMFNLNLRSVFLACRAVVPHMVERGEGKVVNVASAAGLEGEAGHAAYSASKAGVIRLTESLAAEVKRNGVNVNCILPSIIDTPANREALPKADFARWPKPWEVARVILFLASEDAMLLHGTALPVYGLS